MYSDPVHYSLRPYEPLTCSAPAPPHSLAGYNDHLTVPRCPHALVVVPQLDAVQVPHISGLDVEHVSVTTLKVVLGVVQEERAGLTLGGSRRKKRSDDIGTQMT